MAGTINLALTQQFDMDGEPLSGGVLYFFAAATTTPQSAFQDTGLTIPWPNPITLDASGRIPMFYLADGNIKIRLATKTGVTVIAADNLLVIGPSSGGGGGGGVDATTVMATGDIKARFSTGTLGGFVRCNGGTIGSLGAAGITERGNADCQALFEYLWSTTVLQVFSGTTANRGTTANGDWAANKVIALPDLRGRTIAGMDDLGLGAAGRLTSAGLGVSAITLGNAGGREIMSSAQMPSHTHSLQNTFFGGNLGIGTEINSVGVGQDHTHGWGTSGGSSGGVQGVNGRFSTYANSQAGYDLNHAHNYNDHGFAASNSTAPGGNPPGGSQNEEGRTTSTSSETGYSLDHVHYVDVGGTTAGRSNGHYHQISGSTQSVGTTANAPIMPPAMVMTFYIKL